MTVIVAGNFANKAGADSATERLKAGGIEADRICSFALNPPGQHAAYPIGGDSEVSPGAADGGGGALTGAAIGGAIGLGAGLAALPFAGPVAAAGGAAIGAYVGSLAGALNHMGDDATVAHSGDASQDRDHALLRPAGDLVAVNPATDAQQALAINVLREAGARDVEKNEGTWQDGKWIDFDPATEPAVVAS